MVYAGGVEFLIVLYVFGGLVLLGLIGAGVYYYCKHRRNDRYQELNEPLIDLQENV